MLTKILLFPLTLLFPDRPNRATRRRESRRAALLNYWQKLSAENEKMKASDPRLEINKKIMQGLKDDPDWNWTSY